MGRSRCWARWTRSWRLGLDRPVSTKLKCLVETFASRDRASWLRPRCVRQKRISSPAVCGSCSVWTATRRNLTGRYTRGNRRAALAPGQSKAKQPSHSTEVTDDRDTGFRGEVRRALERVRQRPAPEHDRRALDGG